MGHHRRSTCRKPRWGIPNLTACGVAGAAGRGEWDDHAALPYRRHRFLLKIISHAVWLYYLFSLSLREIALILAERGVVATQLIQVPGIPPVAVCIDAIVWRTQRRT
jgi:hypothetical protein